MKPEKDKTAALIGFAIKSGKLLFGTDNIEAAKGRVYSIFYCKTLSEKSQKNMRFMAEKKNAVLIQCVKPLEDITDKKNCKAAAITDVHMHKGIMEALQSVENENYIIERKQ